MRGLGRADRRGEAGDDRRARGPLHRQDAPPHAQKETQREIENLKAQHGDNWLRHYSMAQGGVSTGAFDDPDFEMIARKAPPKTVFDHDGNSQPITTADVARINEGIRNRGPAVQAPEQELISDPEVLADWERIHAEVEAERDEAWQKAQAGTVDMHASTGPWLPRFAQGARADAGGELPALAQGAREAIIGEAGEEEGIDSAGGKHIFTQATRVPWGPGGIVEAMPLNPDGSARKSENMLPRLAGGAEADVPMLAGGGEFEPREGRGSFSLPMPGGGAHSRFISLAHFHWP